MGTKTERSQVGLKEKEIVRGFDSEHLRAPFVLRCGALTIDYIVVLLIPVASLLLGRLLQYDGAKLLNSEINNTGWLITFLLCLTNFIIFPIFSGQSIGKMVTGLRLVCIDGSTVGVRQILLRHLVGYPITILSGMIGFIVALFNKSGRSLHDLIAGTVVVYGKPSRKIETAVRDTKKLKKPDRKASMA